MDFDIATFAVWFLAFLFSTTCHEAAHAWVAYRGGDLTAYEGGQVTLDPIPHIRREPFGMILAPLLSFLFWGFMMGWASAPYDPRWGERYPRRQALMALAGPSANLLLALISFGVIKLLLAQGILEMPSHFGGYSDLVVPAAGLATPMLTAVGTLLSVMLTLNVLLGLFNLLPVPPLDGASVLGGLFPDSIGKLIDMMRSTPMFGLIGILIAWNLFPKIAGPAFVFVLGMVYGTS